MKDKVISDLMNAISETVPGCYLEQISHAASDVLNRYTFTARENTVKRYSDQFPQCYFDYMESLKIQGVSNGTISNYKMRIEAFLSTLTVDIDQLTTSDMRRYIADFKESRHVQNSTVNNLIHILKSFFNWSFHEEYIKRNPMHNVKALKCEKKIMPVLDQTQIEIVCDACTNIRDKAFIDFLYSSGCRISEVVSLNITDIDFKNRCFKVHGKGNKWRTCCITPKCYVSLKKYLQSRNDANEALFVGIRKPHGRITKEGMEFTLRKLGEKCGFDFHLTPHCYRRSMATHASMKGLAVEEVQSLLGHSSIDMTMRYVKVDHEKLKNHYLTVS